MAYKPAQNSINPLQSLFNDSNNSSYDFTYAKYPLNIDDIGGNGHYMNFYINAAERSDYWKGSSGHVYTIPQGEGLFGITSLFGNYQEAPYQEVSIGSQSGGSLADQGFGRYGPKRQFYKRIKSAISLFVPNGGIQFSTAANWQQASMTDVAGTAGQMLQYAQYAMKQSLRDNKSSIVGGSPKTLGDTSFGTLIASELAANAIASATKMGPVGANALLNSFGFSINPQLFMMYISTNLRTFSFSFNFIPANETEARSVRNIVKLFRFHAAPEIDMAVGRFQIPPSTFDIEILHKQENNDNIPKFRTCVLTGINVNYSEAGWSTYADGMPVQTRLTLSFTELDVITKDAVNKGF